MPLPLAYFITWTCYGQRLHGNERGSVDRDHNRRGTPMLEPDADRRGAAMARMAGPVVFLTPEMREIAGRAMEALSQERGWHLMTKNVRTTHAHVVVNCRGLASPEQVEADYKARITRDLRVAGLASADARLWTVHASTRWINHEPGLYGALLYVNDWQAGPNRQVLEEHKRAVKERIRSLKAWLKERGLPEHGKGVVMGESEEEWGRRIRDSQRRRAG